MLARSLLVLLLVASLSGCSNKDLQQIGASHCHAEHVESLPRGLSWEAQATGSPQDHQLTRVYTWMVHRDGGCVSELELSAYLNLDPTATPCGGVFLDSAVVNGTLVLGPKTFIFDTPADESHGLRQWGFGGAYDYPAGTAEGQPQSWVVTMVLSVSHEDLVFAPSIDACVKNAVKDVVIEGRDHDFRE